MYLGILPAPAQLQAPSASCRRSGGVQAGLTKMRIRVFLLVLEAVFTNFELKFSIMVPNLGYEVFSWFSRRSCKVCETRGVPGLNILRLRIQEGYQGSNICAK